MRGIKPVRAAPFYILAWYRPPPDAPPDTFNAIGNNLKFSDNESKEIILLGDTNCDILPNLRKGDCAGACANLPAHSSRLLEVYNLFGFQQLIDRGTRETLPSSTLIDHIATTIRSNIVTFEVHETSISDHYMVYCVRKFRCASRRQHKSISTRQLKNFMLLTLQTICFQLTGMALSITTMMLTLSLNSGLLRSRLFLRNMRHFAKDVSLKSSALGLRRILSLCLLLEIS